MLSFANPEWLFLLPAAPLVFWRRLRQPRAALLFPGAARFAASGRTSWIHRADALGRALIVALLLLAVAGLRAPDLKTRLPSEGIALAVVVDVSGSMATPDFAPGGQTRLDAAKKTFQDFIDQRGNDAIALVAFAATPRTECPPTFNHNVLSQLLNKLEPRSGVDAGTNIGDAIAEALLRLQGSPAKRKAIVLLTDGEHNATGEGVDAPLTPRQAAQLAANLHVPLYAIDCGGEPSATDLEAAKQRAGGRAILQASAELTGGRAFNANDSEQLHAAMQEIDALERTRIESFQYRRYFDFGFWCGLAALALWFLLTLLEATRWRTLP
jgi:Ca-activated chloride channel family protein